MERRKFIKLSATASVFTLLPSDVFACLESVGIPNCPTNNSKKIVLIQLAGANDGINTLVPMNQYDEYVKLRPTIHLKNSGANGIIPLDSTLSVNNQIGLHPVLSGFKNLYESGSMHIVQGVGYPNINKSHFKSSDLWLSGGDGTTANFSIQSGWMGRFVEKYYAPLLNSNFPLGIQLGSGDNSLGFHGEIEQNLSINLNNQDQAGFYSVVNGLGGSPPTNIPNSEYGDRIRFLMAIDAAANKYGETISKAFEKGKNTTSYPDSDLANQLKTVAKFISGGLETKVYLVRLAGFDTHDGQVVSSSESHLGHHANLLDQVSNAVSSFINDLKNQEMGNDVMTMTFSEFGRKAAENANLGTDHGQVAPMFLFGNGINPGISGKNIDLSEATLQNNFQVQTYQYDYRNVFSTVLQDWFGIANDTLDSTFYDFTTKSGFSKTKISNLIHENHLVPTSCYTSTLPEIDTNLPISLNLYPNPASDLVTVSMTNSIIIYSIQIFSIDGKELKTVYNSSLDMMFQFSINDLSVGFYTLLATTQSGNLTKKLIVRR